MGPYGSEERHAEFARVLAGRPARGEPWVEPSPEAAPDLTVSELIAACGRGDVDPRPLSQMKGTPMTGQAQPRRRGSYGIDAPFWAGALAVLIVIEFALAITSGRVWPFLPVLFLLAIAAFVLHTTLRGKFVVWTDLLDQLHLRGDERILDLGCGRGAVLLMAAQRLTTGRAVGVDLWRSADQSGNSAEAARRNAVAEGVADRVELHTGDMTALPFEENSFDLVVSSLAIHNIRGRAGREKAIDEAVRVLCPGGRLMIADMWATGQYQERLAKLGMSDVARRRLGWRFWWGGPWAATRLVSATRPERRIGDRPVTQ